jgi:hypothetical protein
VENPGNRYFHQTLEPKGKWSGMDVPNSPIVDVEPPAERSDLTHIEVLMRNPSALLRAGSGKPVILLNNVIARLHCKGKQAARQADGVAGRGCWKKRMPSLRLYSEQVCNRADRDSRFVPRESGLTSNAGDSLRENAANYLRRESRCRK